MNKSPIYYFTYDSDMENEQFSIRCPQAIRLGFGFIPNHELFLSHYDKRWQSGVYSIREEEGSKVSGVLYELTEEDLERLKIFRKIGVVENFKPTNVYGIKSHVLLAENVLVSYAIKNEPLVSVENYYQSIMEELAHA